MIVTEHTKQAAWQSLLDASRASRYYSLLAQKHRRLKNRKRWMQATAGALASVSFLVEPVIPLSLSGVVLLITVLSDRVLREKADFLDAMSRDADNLEAEFRSLFEQANQDQLQDDFARHTLDQLNRHRLAIGNMVSVDLDDELNQKCTEDVYQVEQDRYAV